jgi:ComF family protein
MKLWNDLFSLFFPEVCIACGNSLSLNEEMVCTSCVLHLPRTHFAGIPDNPVSRVFWGRADLYSATALYYFTKGGRVQHLLHQLKYKGHKKIGYFLGQLLGDELADSPYFNSVEVVIPVPLHPRKKRMRGYNQSEMIAEGICRVLHARLDTTTLYRSRFSETQTRKGRFKRWENVKDIFDVTATEKLLDKHVLLVDDVITTGATLESCTLALKKIPGIRISIACVAYATK